MERFAGDGGLIPEQVWDTHDIPEHDLYFGRPTGSAMPLAWAHAEYVKLCRSLRDGRVFDMPPQTVRRYLVERVDSPHAVWRPDHRRRAIPPGKACGSRSASRRSSAGSADGTTDGREVPTRDSGLGVHYADLPTERLPRGSTVRFTLCWPEGGWLEKKNLWSVKPITVAVE